MLISVWARFVSLLTILSAMSWFLTEADKNTIQARLACQEGRMQNDKSYCEFGV